MLREFLRFWNVIDNILLLSLYIKINCRVLVPQKLSSSTDLNQFFFYIDGVRCEPIV